jgi:hypothetical protein
LGGNIVNKTFKAEWNKAERRQHGPGKTKHFKRKRAKGEESALLSLQVVVIAFLQCAS